MNFDSEKFAEMLRENSLTLLGAVPDRACMSNRLCHRLADQLPLAKQVTTRVGDIPFGGLRVEIDETIPNDEVQIRNHAGTIIKIIKVKL